jgi:hypothetical protein
MRLKAERSLAKSKTIYPFTQKYRVTLKKNFVTINTAAKTSNLTRSYPEMKPRLQEKKPSS